MSNRLHAKDRLPRDGDHPTARQISEKDLLAQAGQLRAKQTARVAGAAFDGIGRALGVVWRVCSDLRRDREKARIADELESLDDRTLNDIGLRRSDIQPLAAGDIDALRSTMAEADRTTTESKAA